MNRTIRVTGKGNISVKPDQELKNMMESYKERTSVKEKLGEKKMQVSQTEKGQMSINRQRNDAR